MAVWGSPESITPQPPGKPLFGLILGLLLAAFSLEMTFNKVLPRGINPRSVTVRTKVHSAVISIILVRSSTSTLWNVSLFGRGP
jgi:hypothetical protein